MHELFATSVSYFGVKIPINSLITLAPLGAAVIFALPSFISVLKQRGPIRGFLALVLPSALAMGVLVATAKTGLPNGKVVYASALGKQIMNGPPWIIALAYPPLLLTAFWLAKKLRTGWFTPLVTAIVAMAGTAVLDPAAVKLRFWQWDKPGPFYGVPLINFAGWLAINLVAAWLLKKLWGDRDVKRPVAFSGFALLCFWSGVNIGIHQWVAGGVGVGYVVILLALMFIEGRRTKKAKESK